MKAMKRRQALKFTAAVLGVTVIGGETFLSGCKTDDRKKDLISSIDISFLDEVAETILPETDRSPGARAAKVGEFMRTMAEDCYSEEEQKIFVDGISTIDQVSVNKYSTNYVNLSPNQKLELLEDLDFEARTFERDGKVHFFSMIKQLTILGYFTSEVGVTKALRYNPIPEGYDGCVDYKKGDSAWLGPLSSLG